MHLLVEELSAIVWTTDQELRITSGFGAGLGAFNLQMGEGIGTSVLDYLPTYDVEDLLLNAHQ